LKNGLGTLLHKAVIQACFPTFWSFSNRWYRFPINYIVAVSNKSESVSVYTLLQMLWIVVFLHMPDVKNQKSIRKWMRKIIIFSSCGKIHILSF